MSNDPGPIFITDDMSLGEYKEVQYNIIDQRTVQLIYQGFSYDGKTFSASLNAQMNWNCLRDNKDEFTWPVEVSTKDHNSYSLIYGNINAFWNVGKGVIKGHLDSGRALKKQIYDAVDKAAVDAVVDTR